MIVSSIWNWDVAIDAMPAMLGGMWNTFLITISAFIVALIVGLILTMLRRIPFKPLALLFYGLTEFIRMTPPLAQLLFVYYAWPQIPVVGVALPSFVAGTFTLGIHYSTYLSEIYRSGIEGVEKGQWEASKALNFSRFDTWRKVILPQAIPPVIPQLGNYLIVMFKETPLLIAIQFNEMLREAYLVGSATYSYVEVFTIAGLLFLVLSYPSSLLIRYLEKRMNNRYARKAKKVERKGVTT
ncbi:ectoine/hydroxyectoine ABC transporter permease subunit EhuD [Bacillaceae bacterium SIJ1]|uniref:ectoine/hydroxyectoine ABC transporter permease subunit EhuD n=1 Tax=Litoribacterium kuwaitense TaxID=1398745 RepID=UPI0013EAB145|nr:ectoine/hydroxyectoine ABC transporter permease subunit EhuD [Litoribacterium kuwaitense]NGP45469.1 ectoine/hydroxyectoine ABC transporter permease subunit EhuD [Litoribacterium kuwaitense]